MWRPCSVNSFLFRVESITSTWYKSFSNLCNFLLKTCVSLLTQEESSRSYLCGGVIAMMFMCSLRSANFLKCWRPMLDSFLLMSSAPPSKWLQSHYGVHDISRRAKVLICSSLEPGITVPLTSKVSPSVGNSSAAHPHAWLSPMIIILHFPGFWMTLLLILTDIVSQSDLKIGSPLNPCGE